MATAITTSPNITSLDPVLTANLCNGNFEVTVIPASVFLPGGASTSGGVQGASIKITNPLGVVIRNYITSGFDIYPPMTSVFSYAIPIIAGNYQYGTYTIDVRLTDHDGTNYYATKIINICPPDPNNKTKKEGCLNASIDGNCKDGKVVILLDQPPNYKNTAFTSQVIDIDISYPTESSLAPITGITYGAFSVALYEGEYKVTGNDCVLYDFGNNVFVKVKYKIACSKIIKCLLDECCVQARLDELKQKVTSDCTQNERDATLSTILLAQFYVTGAKGAASCGEDPSTWIEDLEGLLGCTCTCNCNSGTPIINNTPSTDFVVQGCNVTEETVGLTKYFTVDAKHFKLILDDTTGILSLSAKTTNGCTEEQHINISVATLLTTVKAAIAVPLYRALISQLGTIAPTAVVSSLNTVTGVWSYNSAGIYICTFTGLPTPLTAANTFIITGAPGVVTGSVISAVYNSANSIAVKVTAGLFTSGLDNNLLSHCPIEVSYL